MLVNKCLSSSKQELILIKFNYSNNYYYLNKLATYVYTTVIIISIHMSSELHLICSQVPNTRAHYNYSGLYLIQEYATCMLE